MPHTIKLGSLCKIVWSVVSIACLFAGHTAIADDRIEIANLPPAPSETVDPTTPRSNESSVALSPIHGEMQSKRKGKSALDRPLSRVRASIVPTEGEIPQRARVSDLGELCDLDVLGSNRPWIFTSYEWEAPATRHLPLLFEEPNLERLGYGYGLCDVGLCDEGPHRGQRLQTLVSGAHFFGRIPLIPFAACANPLCEPIYTLGHDRPGSPVPYRLYCH